MKSYNFVDSIVEGVTILKSYSAILVIVYLGSNGIALL